MYLVYHGAKYILTDVMRLQVSIFYQIQTGHACHIPNESGYTSTLKDHITSHYVVARL